MVMIPLFLEVAVIVSVLLGASFTGDRAPEMRRLALTVLSSSWRPEDAFGYPPDPQVRFLWLIVEMRNEGRDVIAIAIGRLSCVIEGVEAGRYHFKQLLGPETIAPGDSLDVTLVFGVPNAWVPTALRCTPVPGSEEMASIPAPVNATYGGSLTLESWHVTTFYQGRSERDWLIANLTFWSTGNVELLLDRHDWSIVTEAGGFAGWPHDDFYSDVSIAAGGSVGLTLVFQTFFHPAKVILRFPGGSELAAPLM